MINVLIADNHPIVRLGIKKMLEAMDHIKVLGALGTTTELFQTLARTNPDIVILEMDIPQINGIATLRKMRVE